ncbi:MAG: sigma-54 dependent transcriptional regulator [Myxococcota bacterium]|nr:sigma-54 dependent transcriptional regulator [Myxococcota bacterium]
MAEAGAAPPSSKRGSPDSGEQPPRILVVDDSEGIRGYLKSLLVSRGYRVSCAEDGESALSLLEEEALLPDLVLLDLMMPGMGGLAALERMREIVPGICVAVISVIGRAPTIVQAMKLGAVDFISKPFEEEDLDRVLELFVPFGQAIAEESAASDEVDDSVWSGSAMVEIRGIIEQISDTDVTVLVQGESGVGKEIVARSIHRLSNRADGPFVKVNCAALPEDLLESELFGYEKGAFTGAYSRKHGKFEVATGGTIFLDEIGEMSPGLQAKLLQVLQDSRFTRLGGNKDVEVDLRVVCATHRPLLEMISRNDFREDLYFRLNVVNIHIPPLRDRREEIAPLVDRFLQKYARHYGKGVTLLSELMREAFANYDFPGNVRELENMLKRIVVLESEDSVLAELGEKQKAGKQDDLDFDSLLEEVTATAGEVPLREVSRRVSSEVERQAIGLALRRTDWNRKKAASLLGVSYKTLLLKIKECGVQVTH